MQTHPVPTFGPFRIVQPSHRRAGVALTQEQRLNQAKQDSRAQADLLVVRAMKAEDRRFSGESITELGAFA